MAAFDDAVVEDGFSPEGYRIIGELDRGGMAVVYHAKQLNPEREVALKVMLPKFSGERDMRSRFQTEARAMATLEHPAIMPIYEVGESERLPFFSMKLAEGGSMAGKLAAGQVKFSDAVEWMVEVAGAVHHAHQRGILHRDLKPGNFLFDGRGQIYVGDFGVAKMMLGEDGGLTRTEAFVGTPNYMPPELAGGAVMKASVAGDLYSLGAVFYECLTGKRPHGSHTNVATLLRAIVDAEIPSARSVNGKVPADLDVICRKALEKDPAARYGSVAEFREDLVRWQQGRAITARPVGWVGTFLRWVKRHPLPASLITTIILLTMGTGLYILWQNYEQRGLIHDQYLKEARFERVIAKPGFRERAFGQLKLAADLQESTEVRNQAAALLAKVDVASRAEGMKNLLPGENVLRWEISGTGKWAIGHDDEGNATLYEVATMKKVRKWERLYGQAVEAVFLGERVMVVEESEDADESSELQVEVTIYKDPHFSTRRKLAMEEPESFLFLAVSPDLKSVALAGENGLQIRDAVTWNPRWKSNKGVPRGRPIWAPNSKTVAAALGTKNEIFFYDVEHPDEPVVYPAKRSATQLAFHPAGRLLALMRSDGVIALVDVFEDRLVTEVALDSGEPGELRFSEDGKTFGTSAQSWELKSGVGYREWKRGSVRKSQLTVFESRLSSDEKWLLTVTNEGLEIWSLSEGRQIGFYGSGNQRIDVRSSAWWLEDGDILLQVPGGLEIIHCHKNGELSFAKRWPRAPRSRVLQVRDDGDWLVEQAEDEDTVSLWIWPGGKMEDARVPEDYGPSSRVLRTAEIGSGSTKAVVLDDETIQVEGQYDLIVTPAEDLVIHQISLTEDGRRLIAVSEGGRVLEWDLEVLVRELEKLGF